MTIRTLAVCTLLGLLITFKSPRASGEKPSELTMLQTRVAELETENKRLGAELRQMQQWRQDAEVRLLYYLSQHLDGTAINKSKSREAMSLASRLARTERGNPLVWRVLVETKVLRDDMSLPEAVRQLGPPTEDTDAQVEWYFNPMNRHVAPYLRATKTQKGLSHWSRGNR